MSFREFVQVREPTETPNLKYTDLDVVSMYYDMFSKKSVKEIAQTTGYSIGEIYSALDRSNLRANRSRVNHHSVMSLASQGFSAQKIAEFTGYTPRNIRYILKNHLSEG